MDDDIKELITKYWVRLREVEECRTEALCNSRAEVAKVCDSLLPIYKSIIEDLCAIVASETRSGV